MNSESHLEHSWTLLTLRTAKVDGSARGATSRFWADFATAHFTKFLLSRPYTRMSGINAKLCYSSIYHIFIHHLAPSGRVFTHVVSADPHFGIRYYALFVKIGHSIHGILTWESEAPIWTYEALFFPCCLIYILIIQDLFPVSQCESSLVIVQRLEREFIQLRHLCSVQFCLCVYLLFLPLSPCHNDGQWIW